jgi:protein transport protein HofC/type IV pilus assembly protein PilC
MPWYSIKHSSGEIDYQYSSSENELFFDCIKNKKWQISITQWVPKKLDYKALLTLYEEIQSALHSGLQLNQAVAHLATSSTHKGIATISKAILSELEKGTLFNEALLKLTNQEAAPYCQLVNSQGTRENCEQSLAISINQLNTLLSWSQRLLKALAYPFSIIQIALIIMIVNRSFQSASTTDYFIQLVSDLGLYSLCSAVQLLVINSLYKGNACYWLERYSDNFRLTKLFSLLSSTRKTGITLQDALKNMPEYFTYKPITLEILKVYYTLHLGKSYENSFPIHWFPNESAIALHSAGQDGDIERALVLAAKEHEKRWQKSVSLLEKLIPALCLFIAGGFVASTLVSLYAPLLEIQ